jgi:hypothetical protein
MRRRAVAVQAGVAAGALAVAAAVWLWPKPPGAPGEVPVAALRPGDVGAVHWDDGSHRVDVVRAVATGRAVWVRIGRSPSLQAPDAGQSVDAGPAPDAGARGRPDGGLTLKEAPPPPDRDLRGNETAEQLLDRVSPPMATRDLGAAGAERRKELGLDASVKRLELETRSGPMGFVVSTPPGSSGAYLLTADGHLWLVPDALVQDLSAATSRLVDRRLHAFRSDEPDAMQLQLDGRSRAFVFRRAQGATKVAPAENPDAPSPEATAFADRAWRLVPTEVLGRGETPREGMPVVSLRLEYTRERKPLGFLEVGRAGSEWFARTEHSVGWMRLAAQASTLREQAERLEAGAPAPR